ACSAAARRRRSTAILHAKQVRRGSGLARSLTSRACAAVAQCRTFLRATQELIRRLLEERLGARFPTSLAMSFNPFRTRAARLLCVLGALACAGVASAQSS